MHSCSVERLPMRLICSWVFLLNRNLVDVQEFRWYENLSPPSKWAVKRWLLLQSSPTDVRLLNRRTSAGVYAVQWLHYTPEWCKPYRRLLKLVVTLEQCKRACLPGCAAIEYWPVSRTCNECLDHTRRRQFTNTFDSNYPPHVYIKQ